MSKYAIKVYGGRWDGEYDGAATLKATERKAREEFVPHVPPHVAVHVVRFSKDGERVFIVKRIKEREFGSRSRATRHADSRTDTPMYRAPQHATMSVMLTYPDGRVEYKHWRGRTGKSIQKAAREHYKGTAKVSFGRVMYHHGRA